jgi:hypothetical protein
MKVRFCILILIIISSVLISSCISQQSEITYEVIIDTEESTTIYLPVPLDKSTEKIADVMDDLKVIVGEADWKITNTPHGIALEIHASEPCRLSARKNDGWNNDLSYTIGPTPSDPFAHISLNVGWQTVKLRRVMILYD